MKKPDNPPHRHTCRALVDLLCDFLEGDLEPDEAKELERHMADCPPCLVMLRTYSRTIELCKSMCPDDIPAALKQKLITFLETSHR
jgi:anti-sigma factor (TIGR02949 family)